MELVWNMLNMHHFVKFETNSPKINNVYMKWNSTQIPGKGGIL